MCTTGAVHTKNTRLRLRHTIYISASKAYHVGAVFLPKGKNTLLMLCIFDCVARLLYHAGSPLSIAKYPTFLHYAIALCKNVWYDAGSTVFKSVVINNTDTIRESDLFKFTTSLESACAEFAFERKRFL